MNVSKLKRARVELAGQDAGNVVFLGIARIG
jgi:hypothetical protein